MSLNPSFYPTNNPNRYAIGASGTGHTPGIGDLVCIDNYRLGGYVCYVYEDSVGTTFKYEVPVTQIEEELREVYR